MNSMSRPRLQSSRNPGEQFRGFYQHSFQSVQFSRFKFLWLIQQCLLAAPNFLHFGEIIAEDVAFEDAVLKAGKIGRQLWAGLGWQ